MVLDTPTEQRAPGRRGFVTLAVTPRYHELARNLALSCRRWGIPLTVISEAPLEDTLFDRVIVTDFGFVSCEEIWAVKGRVYDLTAHYDLCAYVDADSLVLNNPTIVFDTAQQEGFHIPNEKTMDHEERWIFKVRCREVATLYGIPTDTHLPQVNGGFFCWQRGQRAQAWFGEFARARAWLIEKMGIGREEPAMWLASAKLGYSKYWSDCCVSMWIVHTKRIHIAEGHFTCMEHYTDRVRYFSIGHFGSCNTKLSDESSEYRACVAQLKSVELAGV